MAKATQEERQARIVELIIDHGSLRVDDLADLFGVSVMTLYRDLAALEAHQVIARHRGTVSLLVSSISEAPFAFRLYQETEAKEAVAREAARLVSRYSSIFVDDSSTAYLALDHIGVPESKAFITNASHAAIKIGAGEHQSLTMLGGRFDRALDAYFGPTTNRQVGELAFETALIGAASVKDGSIYHPFSEAALFKREVIARTEVPILAITADKLSRVALHRLADLSDFSYLIIDDTVTDQDLNYLHTLTNVIVANKEGKDNV
ncbi:hypothetical protein HMPREF3167_05750 [Trueperella sp. HMSC08B05]|uniref:DeoR/GlpR family DNA-binding transcription regulator n=1 Tax=Trueperella TaxID=1069494 RepID=UPI0008A5F778|nr:MULTISPECIES: DeoR/GlpR family DNA-binding transcription regulator [Trueperella]OFS67847.1 hypothetical protein HMPREF3174_02545 [Trueperella sp. HMSC08H06]OFS74292.1 hypothetical protein HMPREF3167_05750 [Trueperella sp. HMSC08B05]